MAIKKNKKPGASGAFAAARQRMADSKTSVQSASSVMGDGDFVAKYGINVRDENLYPIGSKIRFRFISGLGRPFPFCHFIDTRRAVVASKEGEMQERAIIVPGKDHPEHKEAMAILDHAEEPLENRKPGTLFRALVYVYGVFDKDRKGVYSMVEEINEWRWLHFAPGLMKSWREMKSSDQSGFSECLSEVDKEEIHWLGVPEGTDLTPMYDVDLVIVKGNSKQFPRNYEFEPVLLEGRNPHPHFDVSHEDLINDGIIDISQIIDLEAEPEDGDESAFVLTELGEEIYEEMTTFQLGADSTRFSLGYKKGQNGPNDEEEEAKPSKRRGRRGDEDEEEEEEEIQTRSSKKPARAKAKVEEDEEEEEEEEKPQPRRSGGLAAKSAARKATVVEDDEEDDDDDDDVDDDDDNEEEEEEEAPKPARKSSTAATKTASVRRRRP